MSNNFFGEFVNKKYNSDGRETMIVFVYDTECCKDEADDPVNAVLYFHPSWVSDTQKLALCGQLMGTSYFLKNCFSKPKSIALENGKFVFREFGRFVLAVGTDRNISVSLLEHRADLLESLLTFYHRDIQTLYEKFSSNGQYKNLSDKLYHVFETYLPILQYNGNIFHNVPKLKIPKSASNIFLDAIQTLQSCQQTKGVIGGAILYHNKVVASQLSEKLTKNLVLTDPYRIKSTAEPITANFHVPIGVQMMVVYISTEEYQKLITDSQRSQNLQTQNLSSNILPYQYQKRKIKRDKSLIFTNIPEESTSCDSMVTSTKMISDGPPINRFKHLNRPNHLPLRFKNVPAKEKPESGFSSISFDETDSFPEFIGRTSICSTPMTENKVLHGTIMSICANPTENLVANEENDMKKEKKSSLKIEFDKFFANFISNPNKIERRNSFSDLQDSIKKISKRLSINPFAVGELNINQNDNDITPNTADEAEKYYASSLSTNRKSRSITDPTYPVFNSEGQPISKSLFQEILDKYCKSWEETPKKDDQIVQLIEEFKEFDSELKKLENSKATKKINENTMSENLIEKCIEQPKALSDRKSLTLPLKPLNDDKDDVSVTLTNNGFEKKKLSGIQLTPLMAKLSILAMNEERSGSFNTWDTTPGIELATPIDGSKMFRRKSSIKMDNNTDCILSSDGLHKVELYVCGQQNMTLFLLLEEGSGNNQELVQAMFEICVSKLARMESNLNQSLNVNVEGDKSEGGYSFMCLDSKWDTIQRGGPWTPSDLISLEKMHKDLNLANNITDLILRTNDSVIYGYKSGRTEIFYKESAHQYTGIPPPSDPLGTIAMRSKKRLERDHTFVLF